MSSNRIAKSLQDSQKAAKRAVRTLCLRLSRPISGTEILDLELLDSHLRNPLNPGPIPSEASAKMATEVMTVLGPVPTVALGVTLPHEHLFLNLHRLTMDDDQLLFDVPLAIQEAGHFRSAGGTTLVDVTNRGLGRRPEALRRVAEATGLHIIMGCGWYKERYYGREVYETSTNTLADEMVRDITQGVGETGIRAGIIGEIGTLAHYIEPSEERVFRAAARAHLCTGLTITTHAVASPVGLDQLDLLAEEGVDPRRVIIGHCDSHPDESYHEALARRGAYVEFDRVQGKVEPEMDKRVG